MALDSSTAAAAEISLEDKQAEERRRERAEHINPPDDQPFATLACAVIHSAAKEWINTGNVVRDDFANQDVADFFLGPDYRFWRAFTGLQLEGSEIVELLAENGGLKSAVHFVRADDGGETD